MSLETEVSVVSPEQNSLRHGSIGLPGVLFQSITTMAPASAVAFSLSPALPATGITLPLAALIALVVCALIALNIGALAKYLPSAGGYFTYVSNALGVQAGWMTGWSFNLAYLLIVPFQLLVLGPTAESFVVQYFHLSLGWYTWVVIFTIAVFALTYFGIKISADAGVIMGAIEVGLFTVLSIWLIATAGNSNTAGAFNPAHSAMPGLGGLQGVFVGMIFVFVSFAGFESSAALAEESRNPRQIVPRAVFLAAICIGIFYVLCSYAAVVGWGPAHIATYANDANPWGTMAQRVWGPFQFLVILVILNSALANANAGVNAASRVIYAMARIKTLPTIFARVNRWNTPDVAIFLTMIVALVCALVPGFLYTPSTAFALLGTILILPILLVYILTCISVPVFYLKQHRDEFNVLRHIIVPVLPLIVLLAVVYYQFSPIPAAPLGYAGPVVLAWLIIGAIIVALLQARAPEQLAQASKVYVEGGEEDYSYIPSSDTSIPSSDTSTSTAAEEEPAPPEAEEKAAALAVAEKLSALEAEEKPPSEMAATLEAEKTLSEEKVATLEAQLKQALEQISEVREQLQAAQTRIEALEKLKTPTPSMVEENGKVPQADQPKEPRQRRGTNRGQSRQKSTPAASSQELPTEEA
ncbi:MAG TPA: amino acid permease [Ktedonobacteraceae bacterium]|nr:amino acid permease [Ktedonobacteraceae bacterium]